MMDPSTRELFRVGHQDLVEFVAYQGLLSRRAAPAFARTVMSVSSSPSVKPGKG